MGAAKEYLGKAIQEMFIVKKDAEVKRFLPSIKNMKIVSVAFRDPPPMTDWVIASARAPFRTKKHADGLQSFQFSRHFARPSVN